MRKILVAAVSVVSLLAGPAVAWACGGLVNPNGTVALVKTTTLAGYRFGVEHYITSFEFQGGGEKFGSIVPLPGIPSKVRRGGDWTLQRLVREVTPQRTAEDSAAPTSGGSSGEAEVIMEKTIDSVKITILKGGAKGVGRWAKNNGFALTPDAPEVLDHYAQLSRIFMAAAFDPKDAEKSGKSEGDGVPIHLNIRTDDPWVPLRILALGQEKETVVEADVFLLTKREPNIVTTTNSEGGLIRERSESASKSLLRDLRSDKGGMKWVTTSGMWLSYLRVDEEARDLTYDLWASVPSRDSQRSRQAALPTSAVWSWAASY